MLPAMAVAPKVLTEACTNRLAKQNTAPCSAEGTPVFKILPMAPCAKESGRKRRQNSVSFVRRRSARPAESAVERPVAMATPETPRGNTTTNSKLSTALAVSAGTGAQKGCGCLRRQKKNHPVLGWFFCLMVFYRRLKNGAETQDGIIPICVFSSTQRQSLHRSMPRAQSRARGTRCRRFAGHRIRLRFCLSIRLWHRKNRRFPRFSWR